MRVYLSSFQLGAGSTVLRASRDDAQAALVMNALDPWPDARSRHGPLQVEALTGLGYRVSELDLRDYFHRPGALAERLDSVDLVWATGGNAFVLARAMTRAGFGSALRPRLETGRLTYAGYSAGACVAGPDLRGIDLMDQPSALPAGYDEQMEPDCLGLVPFRVVPHWRSDHRESADAERAAEFLARTGLEHRCLSDGQVLYHDDDGRIHAFP
jgi:dipeptidase E